MLHTEHWRVAHAFDSRLPGWLAVLPRVFTYFGADEEHRLPEAERDAVAVRLRAALP